jgi:signal peptidase I
MQNTLQIDDRVAVNKLPFIAKSVKRGDVVVFRDPANWLPLPVEEVSGNKIIATAKEVLVFTGVLPNPAKQYLVKRVIGVAGDKVVCCDAKGGLTINGKATHEPYIFAGNKPSEMNFNVTVPEGKIWVMGDHRGASADSRYHQDDVNNGMVPLSKVTGRVFGIIWPLKNFGYVASHDPLATK